ncbi:phosphatidylinositol-glycan biosynthesis class F protein isoform X1 [Eublepharis macularius]|uniref:Phosphatidylinositol-glycan biosynthesis class F protein isoform X1 n=1 Tax=Eublepharis macularius TaxID=481883 RepID=A0AA97JMP4_EUBMA|nr:phosphatidylinositol-glycan biosynthesis class F protein isoform X1 [Eublepharis macularius]XP_054839924.1 phosphatidylinositol-glycan biosynthesis class F protein isoform X1 [Eublepharis macularius]XP_054839931.1 phosphatidylinositol-glycan biosynthesis class F protein isoform X1 [Eublepharis macularius]
MRHTEIKRLLSVNVVCIASIILTTLVPSLFLENFSVLGTHLIWLCICSASVGTGNVILYLIFKPNPSMRRNSIAHKVAKFIRCCVYFFVSCILFHGIIVLYGAPLIESILETFLFAVLLSTFTTLHCLCVLGPNFQAWLRVFSKNGAMSIWDNNLQITTMCSVVGAWLGAFPIPLDWDRPWQVWPISCSLGATFGYVAGLLIAPLWIYWNRKQLTYKSR